MRVGVHTRRVPSFTADVCWQTKVTNIDKYMFADDKKRVKVYIEIEGIGEHKANTVGKPTPEPRNIFRTDETPRIAG